MKAGLGLPHPSDWLDRNVKEVVVDVAELESVTWPPFAQNAGLREGQRAPSSARVARPQNWATGHGSGPKRADPPSCDTQLKSPPRRRRGKNLSSRSRAPAVTFEDVDEVVVLDVKTAGLDPERDRVVALVMIKATLSEILETSPLNVTRSRSTFHPGRPISRFASRTHGIKDADVENSDVFVDEAQSLRTFISDLPVIAHDVKTATSFLDREFTLAGVETLQGNRKCCTRRRFERDTRKGTGSTLQEMGTALNLWRFVKSPADAEDKDAMTTLLGATHFWLVDNHSKARSSSSPTKRRLISNDAFTAVLDVLVRITGIAMLIKGALPSLVGMVAVLAFSYWMSPGVFAFMLFLFPAFGWFAWWALKRAEEIDREQSGE